MKKKLELFSVVEQCPVRNILDRIGDKWSMLILLVLHQESTLRFNQIHKIIGSISQKMLSTTLKRLEADGLISRTLYAEVPPRVEYELTARARTLMPHINGLVDWANEHFEEIKQSRIAYK